MIIGSFLQRAECECQCEYELIPVATTQAHCMRLQPKPAFRLHLGSGCWCLISREAPFSIPRPTVYFEENRGHYVDRNYPFLRSKLNEEEFACALCNGIDRYVISQLSLNSITLPLFLHLSPELSLELRCSWLFLGLGRPRRVFTYSLRGK